MICTPFNITVRNPRRKSTGAGPIENIVRNITDVANVLTPDGRGTVHTLTNDNNVIAHIKPFRWEFNSVEEYDY